MDKEIKIFNIRYADIQVSKFSQFDLKAEYDKETIPLVNFNSNFEFKVIPEQERITCVVSVIVSIIETGESLCELNVNNNFDVKSLDKIVKPKKDGGFDLPNDILSTIVSLSISTVRGILHEKSKGTIIQGEVYPLINPSALFNKRAD